MIRGKSLLEGSKYNLRGAGGNVRIGDKFEDGNSDITILDIWVNINRVSGSVTTRVKYKWSHKDGSDTEVEENDVEFTLDGMTRV